MELSGKTTLVTGGGSGIGAELCRRFTAEGATVVVVDRDEDAALDVAEEIDGTALIVDVGTAEENTRMIVEAEDAVGPIDLLCLNAGIGNGGGVEAPDESWDQAWRVNVMAHVWATRAWLPGALERGEGYLLHTASAAGMLSNIGAAPYTVSKHAVLSLAEWLSITHGDQGITVSALCPMFVETPMVEALREWPGGKGLTALGVISPTEVADAVVAGLADERFLILPHPAVAEMEVGRATDRDRWLGGMRKLQRRVLAMES
ncbi:SDR family oxidoreductase [Euzebya tangerina]|uniref:SDR family oxidoreductase n=1 Tax=Euzebya tangerina TaxID=591198 RepID=UPI000E31F44D|nr:SDR family oxidoreductase [Euzebya tangerina]